MSISFVNPLYLENIFVLIRFHDWTDLVVYEAVADPHDEEGDASVGRGEVDHYTLAVLGVGVGQQVGTEIGTQSATVPGGV